MARNEDKSYYPGVLITGQRALLVTVAIIGVVAHGALGVWAWEKQVVDMPVIESAPARPIAIKRAQLDEYKITPPTIDPTSVGPTAEELTKQLLEAEPPKLVTEPLELDVELRPLDEINDASVGALEIELPAFELDNDVLAQLDTRPPAELSFGEGEGNPGQADEGVVDHGYCMTSRE